MRRLGSAYFHLMGLAVLLCSRMQRISFRLRSAEDLKMPRWIRSRSILLNPQLDLVEPRRVGRGEVKVDVLLEGQEVSYTLGLMCGEVVEKAARPPQRRRSALRDPRPPRALRRSASPQASA